MCRIFERLLVDFIKKHAPSIVVDLLRWMRYGIVSPRRYVFTRFYYEPFIGREDFSGTGSAFTQTATIAGELPCIIEELKVKTMLDAPCGDFYWMRNVKLGLTSYVGVDIVRDIIKNHVKRFSGNGRSFKCLDVTMDCLPQVDMIFSRDMTVHLSNRDVMATLRNFKKSGSKYLLTTTFPSVKENGDILSGEWRPVNLECAPFGLPRPLKLINECCTESNGKYSDKSLGLWRLTDLFN